MIRASHVRSNHQKIGGSVVRGQVGLFIAAYVVSLDKKLYSTLSLFTQVYKWAPATYCWDNPAMD